MPIIRIIFFIFGTVSLIFGIIGIFLPLLPTTPLLLLSAFLYYRSSPKVYNWLMARPLIGKYIRDFRENKIIPIRVKIISLTLLWVSISYCVLFVLENLVVKILLCVVLVAVTAHILSFKSK